jgi:hypothetical protein
MEIKNNWEEIKKKIWNINKFYDYNHSIEDYDVLVNLTEITNLVESIQKEAYREGFKAAEEKLNTKNPSIGEIRITPDLLEFLDLMEDEYTGEKMLYLYETDELTKAAGIYTDAWHNDTYQISFYGIETNDDFKVIVTATVYDTEELKIRYPDVAGNILKISDAGEMEVTFNDKELEIIKTEFDKTVAEYKRCKEGKIKGELQYIKNPNRYIDVYNSYKDKTIAYPLAEYLDIKASQSGFDNYEDMLNEGLKIDYSGEYIKEPDKQHNNDDIELD